MRRLQSDAAAERARDANRAAGIGADGERDEAAADRRRRAAAGAAGNAVVAPGVVGREVVRIARRDAARELVRIGFAEHDRAGGAQPPDGLGVGGGDVFAKETRPVRRPQTGGVAQVFDGDRNPVQWTATATVHELFGEAIGVATRLVGAHGDERLHAIVGGGDARERGVGQLAWRERPRGNRRRKLRDALSMQVIAACHRRPCF